MGWLGDWLYRKSVTLSRASGAVTNYQMKLLVGESSGATGEDVDCDSKCLTTFDDIRFTNSDGTTLLDYWIESISGTTPNQLATVWIEFDSIGTGATTFYMYYGNADATAVSSGANTFIVFDDFERGNDGDTIGGVWTELYAHVHISTEQAYTGIASHTRSAKLVGGNGSYDSYPRAELTLEPSENISIRFRLYKEDAAYIYPLYHGNGTKRVYLEINSSEYLNYYNAAGSTINVGSITADAWVLLECNNFNWTAYTYDIWLNDTKIKSGAEMHNSANANGKVWIIGDYASGRDAWFDNFIVRNYRSTEPVWGTWGLEEGLITGTIETVTITDDIEATHLAETITDEVTLTDSITRIYEAIRDISDTATLTDSIETLHLVDVTSETATITDIAEPDELIRKRVKFPNLQGKHLSLKFTSATSGSFAIYYLRHKMFKTRELTSDQKHPNTHGSHLGLKLHNTGTDDFILMYVSEKMQLVTT